jgi:hypothetical protein
MVSMRQELLRIGCGAERYSVMKKFQRKCGRGKDEQGKERRKNDNENERKWGIRIRGTNQPTQEGSTSNLAAGSYFFHSLPLSLNNPVAPML